MHLFIDRNTLGTFSKGLASKSDTTSKHLSVTDFSSTQADHSLTPIMSKNNRLNKKVVAACAPIRMKRDTVSAFAVFWHLLWVLLLSNIVHWSNPEKNNITAGTNTSQFDHQHKLTKNKSEYRLNYSEDKQSVPAMMNSETGKYNFDGMMTIHAYNLLCVKSF